MLILCFDTKLWTWISKTFLKLFHNENFINTPMLILFSNSSKNFILHFISAWCISTCFMKVYLCFKIFTSCLTWSLSSPTTCRLKEFAGSSFLYSSPEFCSWPQDQNLFLSCSCIFLSFWCSYFKVWTLLFVHVPNSEDFFFNLLTVVFLLLLTNLILWGKVFQKQIFKLLPWCFSLW